MALPLGLTPPQLQTMGLGLACWIWFFLLAPARAFKVGVDTDAIPVIFKMSSFKLARVAALVALVALGYFMPIADGVAALANRAFFAGSDVLAPPLAIGLSALILFIPWCVAKMRARAETEPGGWSTPALACFGWFWLGMTILATLGVPQDKAYIPALGSVVEVPISSGTGIALAIAGIAFYMLWWGLPGRACAKRAAGGDVRASGYLIRVRWVGLPAWLGFLLSAPRKRRRSATASGDHKLCPSCMRAIDDIEEFASLDFDHCPHCKELIPAPFTAPQFITHCAERIMAAKAMATSKRTAKHANKLEEDYVQHMLRAILCHGVRCRATDVHVGNDSNQLGIRFRIDGVLKTLFTFPLELNRPIISVIKVQARLDISEQRRPQDGSFKTAVDDLKLDVRVNTSPTSEGESASLRLIYRNRCMDSIENLGINKHARTILEEAIRHPHGLILVTGPTGSGKSTTLYNSLAAIADGRRNIITLEDPIEFKVDGLTQMQIDPKKGFSFSSGLRTILRQDPDVIMIGEVRDEDTAKMAVDASMTGHLVFTTLHTIDTVTAIGRLLDLGVDPRQHAEALLLILAQRLGRLICKHCAEDYEVTADEMANLGFAGGPPKLRLKRGVGCDRCLHTGYYEREGIHEVMPATSTIKNLIAEKAPPFQIRDQARREGMRTLLEDGLAKVILGRTTLDELKRVTS